MKTRDDRGECVVFGAGALGLGFLGPELTPNFRIPYVDIPAKGDLLDYLASEGRYVVNETGPSARRVSVEHVRGVRVDDEESVERALNSAELVFTSVGEPNLSRVAPTLAEEASQRTGDAPLRILCCENGVEIAEKLRGLIGQNLGEALEGRARVGDTVMGRMCQIAEEPKKYQSTVTPACDWAVVGEPFFGMPVEEHVVEGLPVSCAALQPCSPAVFAGLEDVKMLAHNGLHAFLAFLGALKGKELFCQLREEPDVMELARGLLVDEGWTALHRKHGPALDRNYYLNYAPTIMRRITCPGFGDAVSRGIRGAMRKLRPWERMVYSVRTVAGQGVRPENAAMGLAAGIEVARRQGETDLSFHEVLTEHCGFSEDEDVELIDLVTEKRRGLEDCAGSSAPASPPFGGSI